MFGFINRIIIKNYYKKFISVLDEQSGKPNNVSDWRIRVETCKNLIENINDENKIIALNKILEESKEQADLLGKNNLEKHLLPYKDVTGYDRFKQIGGRKFASEVWFHKNKRIISIVSGEEIIDYEAFGSHLGKWYKYTSEGKEFQITLGLNSPKQILISIEDENGYDSFKIDLEEEKKI